MSPEQLTEWNRWKIVIVEARAAGIHPNNKNADPLFRAIEAWAEALVALRVTQSQQQRDEATAMAVARYKAAIAKENP